MSKARPNEFIALIAMLTATVAMSIDTMLPALGTIARDLGATNANDRQFVIYGFFAGLTFGTLIFGPVSDAVGRKPTIFAGLALYVVGSLICMFATSFSMLVVGRVIQGFAAASPRIVSIAMVRDGFAGAGMARVMSFVMSVFMIVPIIAPSIGTLVLEIGSWRAIFGGLLVAAVLAGVWLALRQPETLTPEKRVPFTVRNMLSGAAEVVRHPVSLGYTMAVGGIFAGFTADLASCEQLFVEQYGQGKAFALWFAFLALAMVAAQMFNGRRVMKLGMRRITKFGVWSMLALSIVMLVVTQFTAGHPPLPIMVGYLFSFFFCSGLLFGNYNAMALEPMGHIAGMASAVSGFLSSLVAVTTGTWAGSQYEGSFTLFALMFAGSAIWALAWSEWAEARRARALRAAT